MRTLGEIGEFGMIERLTRVLPSSPGVIEGIGDDCAIVRISDRLLLVSCDMFVEDVHFRRSTAGPLDIGWKAAAAAVSDIAAMGGVPAYALVSLACPPDTGVVYLEQLCEGMAAALARSGAVIVGGDTTRSPGPLTIDVTVMGEPSGGRCLKRKGARHDDIVVVTGPLGLSAAGLHAAEAGHDEPELIDAHRRPKPRIAEGQWLCGKSCVHAMIDISDGLVQDLGHIAKANNVGVDLRKEALVPAPSLKRYCEKHSLDSLPFITAGGEDYELAFTVDMALAQELLTSFHKEFGWELTVVGELTGQWTGVRIDGEEPARTGFDHFKN